MSATESGTPAPGEDDLRVLHAWATRATRDIGATDERIRVDIATANLRSLLSASPASETPREVADVIYAGIRTVPHIAERRALAERIAADVLAVQREDFATSVTSAQERFHAEDAAAHQPASETPGPGEGDLRGEVRDHESQVVDGHWRCLRCGHHPADCCDLAAAVEQRTLAEQKVARVEALWTEHKDGLPEGFRDRCVCLGCQMGRAALTLTTSLLSSQTAGTATNPLSDPAGLEGQEPGPPFVSPIVKQKVPDVRAEVLAYLDRHEHPDGWGVTCVYTKGLRAALADPEADRGGTT